MVKKRTWQQLMATTNSKANILNTDNEELIKEVADKINEIFWSSGTHVQNLKKLADYLTSHFLNPSSETLVWKDLKIFVSEFKETDERLPILMGQKLKEYLLFYYKILTDKGVQRALIYAKDYSNDGTASSNERNANSEVPQYTGAYDSQHPESDAKFDEAIYNYASNLGKNKADSTSHSEGDSTTTVSGTTWEEAKKNLQMVYFNELKDYLYSIPERIYSWYSIDCLPAPELYRQFVENMKNAIDMYEDE